MGKVSVRGGGSLSQRPTTSPPVDRMTDACKNITLSQTSFLQAVTNWTIPCLLIIRTRNMLKWKKYKLLRRNNLICVSVTFLSLFRSVLILEFCVDLLLSNKRIAFVLIYSWCRDQRHSRCEMICFEDYVYGSFIPRILQLSSLGNVH